MAAWHVPDRQRSRVEHPADYDDEGSKEHRSGLGNKEEPYGRQEETEAANARLQIVLDAIAAIYPEGALK